MRARITCLHPNCGDVNEIHSREEFVNWADEINAHGMHYPAQRGNEFKVEIMDDCPPMTSALDCPANIGRRGHQI